MSMFDAVTYAIAEGSAHIVARIFGRTFKLDPALAQRIGERVIFGLIAAVFVTLAILGVGT